MTKDEITAWALANGWQVIDGFPSLTKPSAPHPAIVTAMVYSFVRAVTAVSAVIFLTTAQYNLATVYIVGRADIGEYGVALVYSGILIVTMMAALGAIRLFVGQQRIGRREIVVIGA